MSNEWSERAGGCRIDQFLKNWLGFRAAGLGTACEFVAPTQTPRFVAPTHRHPHPFCATQFCPAALRSTCVIA